MHAGRCILPAEEAEWRGKERGGVYIVCTVESVCYTIFLLDFTIFGCAFETIVGFELSVHSYIDRNFARPPPCASHS